jgi:hypothetical protein
MSTAIRRDDIIGLATGTGIQAPSTFTRSLQSYDFGSAYNPQGRA